MVLIETYLFKNIDRIHEVYDTMPSQKAESCGPYSITPILISYGFTHHKGNIVDEDYLAFLARTRMLKSEAEERRKILAMIKRGELSYDEALKKAYHILYKYDLPETELEVESGTSIEGVIYALELVSDGRLKSIPIPSRRGDKILFEPNVFNPIVKWIINSVGKYDFQMVLNYRTSQLLDPTSPVYNYFNLLLKWNTPDKFPKWSWEVGHFVGVNGFQVFREGGKEAIYFIIRDTYKEFGFRGYHLQPMEHIRRSLIRDDGREGGILLIVNSVDYQKVYEELRRIEGVEFGVWDNGSPF